MTTNRKRQTPHPVTHTYVICQLYFFSIISNILFNQPVCIVFLGSLGTPLTP